MRAGSLGRWYARFAVVSAVGAAAFAFAAGPAAAEAPADRSTGSATTLETDWQVAPSHADGSFRLLETDWQ
jgi:hypothetical protein